MEKGTTFPSSRFTAPRTLFLDQLMTPHLATLVSTSLKNACLYQLLYTTYQPLEMTREKPQADLVTTRTMTISAFPRHASQCPRYLSLYLSFMSFIQEVLIEDTILDAGDTTVTKQTRIPPCHWSLCLRGGHPLSHPSAMEGWPSPPEK